MSSTIASSFNSSFNQADMMESNDVIELYSKVKQFQDQGLYDKTSERSVWEQFKLHFPEVVETVKELQDLFYDPIMGETSKATPSGAASEEDVLNNSIGFDHLTVSWEDVSHHKGRYYNILHGQESKERGRSGRKRAASQSPTRTEYQKVVGKMAATEEKMRKRPRHDVFPQRARVSLSSFSLRSHYGNGQQPTPMDTNIMDHIYNNQNLKETVHFDMWDKMAYELDQEMVDPMAMKVHFHGNTMSQIANYNIPFERKMYFAGLASKRSQAFVFHNNDFLPGRDFTQQMPMNVDPDEPLTHESISRTIEQTVNKNPLMPGVQRAICLPQPMETDPQPMTPFSRSCFKEFVKKRSRHMTPKEVEIHNLLNQTVKKKCALLRKLGAKSNLMILWLMISDLNRMIETWLQYRAQSQDEGGIQEDEMEEDSLDLDMDDEQLLQSNVSYDDVDLPLSPISIAAQSIPEVWSSSDDSTLNRTPPKFASTPLMARRPLSVIQHSPIDSSDSSFELSVVSRKRNRQFLVTGDPLEGTSRDFPSAKNARRE